MNYEIWHDENKNNGEYWHGVLLIPVQSTSKLLELLKIIRKEFNYQEKMRLKFSGTLGNKKKSQYIRNILQLFSYTLQVKSDNISLTNRLGRDIHKKEINPYLELTELLGCKYGLLHIPNNHNDMFNTMSYGDRVEKTFSFVIKSCLHGMFSENKPIHITKILFDGYEHNNQLPNRTSLFNGELRRYVSIDDNLEIDSHNRRTRSNDTGILIDFMDNIVGAWQAKLSESTDIYKSLFPLADLDERLRDNKIFSNVNSRWYKSISCSRCYFEDEDIRFEPIHENISQIRLDL